MNVKRRRASADAATFRASSDDPYESVHTQSNYDDLPHCMYFYYITMDPNGIVKVRCYYEMYSTYVKHEDVEYEVKKLALNARKPRIDQFPPPCGDSCNFMVWTRVSYLAFVIDIQDYKLPVPTQYPKMLHIDRNHGMKNHTIYDAVEKMIDLPPTQSGKTGQRPAVWCINHMKADETGQAKIPRELQRFYIRIHTDPELTLSYDTFPDSGGTNMGPPVPPP
jgi:hypothetical protein